MTATRILNFDIAPLRCRIHLDLRHHGFKSRNMGQRGRHDTVPNYASGNPAAVAEGRKPVGIVHVHDMLRAGAA
jgi:hypothetical protein